MLRTLFARVLLVAALLPAHALAQLPPGVTRGVDVEGVTQFRLDNGLEVLFYPDDSKPTTTVNVTYKVGSRHENYGETGMAHLLEHLMFQGSPSVENLWKEFGKRGMEMNGTTFYDRTNYFESFPASDENLAFALKVEAERMTQAFIRKSSLDSEMTVVRNEFESGENNPLMVLWQKMQAASFDWHAYGKSTIGARSDIENVDIGRLQAFYRTYYQPDNAVLVVAGKFDPKATLEIVAREFGRIPKPARELPRLYTSEPTADGERSVTVRRTASAQYVGALFHVMPGAHPDYAAMEALGEIMTVAPAHASHHRPLCLGPSPARSPAPGTIASRAATSSFIRPAPTRASSCTIAMISDTSNGRRPSRRPTSLIRLRASGGKIAAVPPCSASRTRIASTQRASSALIRGRGGFTSTRTGACVTNLNACGAACIARRSPVRTNLSPWVHVLCQRLRDPVAAESLHHYWTRAPAR